jgi:uncharacterized protein YqhQ
MRKTAIGGTALIEGLMMIGSENAAIAIRKPDGEILVEKRNLPVKSRFAKVPILRGVISFIRQMLLSVSAMMFSADFIELDDREAAEGKGWLDRLLGRFPEERVKEVTVIVSLVFSLSISIGLFILLPNILASLLRLPRGKGEGVFLLNFSESVFRAVIFTGYLALASNLREMKRVWQYHGAEHKTINCYENEEELTVENVMKHTTKNPRCSTSYLFVVILVSILVFSLLGWYGIFLNILIRLLLLPVVAGLSFELFRFAANSESWAARAIAAPGMLLQLLTTKEPDEHQVMVAIAAFESVAAASQSPLPQAQHPA